MLRYAIRSLRANLLRFVSTLVAVVMGVGFLASGLMLTDSIGSALAGNVERRYSAVDVAVLPPEEQAAFGNVLPAGLLEDVRAVPGVVAAAGERSAPVRFVEADRRGGDRGTVGRVWMQDPELNPFTVVEGRAPGAVGEVVPDIGLAGRVGVSVGDAVEVRTPVGMRSARVVGLAGFAGGDSFDPDGTILLAESGAREWFGSDESGVEAIIARTDGDPSVVRAAVREVVGGGADVLDRDGFVERRSRDGEAILGALRPALIGFAVVALIVCAFVIFNTFSVVVTQRTRELALARAVAATPAQVRRSIRIEGLVVGVVGSLVGLVGGAAFTMALRAVLAAVWDVRLPGVGLVVTPRTAAACLAAGVLVTFVSSLIPAFRAGSTRPVEALRTSDVDRSGTSKVRLVLGTALPAAGVVLLVIRRTGWGGGIVLGLGGVLLLVGLMVGGPVLVAATTRLLSPVARRSGVTAGLVVGNAARAPRRTAITVMSLVVGLQLVTVMTVSGGAIKGWVVERFESLSGSDVQIVGERGISPELVAEVQGTPGVIAAVPIRLTALPGGSGPATILSGADPELLLRAARLDVKAGDVADVAEGGVAVVDFAGGAFAGAAPIPTPRLGDELVVTAADGREVRLPVVAVLGATADTLFLANLVSPATLTELVGPQPVFVMLTRTDPGDRDATLARLDAAVADYAGVELAEGSIFAQAAASAFDVIIGAVNALLGVSVLIAIVGIVNTMTLAIWERRRELAMLRCLGMTRTQVARMVAGESVFMATLGTVLGVGTGVFLSWVLIGSIGDQDIALNPNWARVALIVLVGVAGGVPAAWPPTRRALGLDPIEAVRQP